MSEAAPELSIAVPVKDGAAYLDETLDQIGAFTAELGCPFELLVVDDGSRDATPEILARRSENDPCLHVLTHPYNRGKGAALKTAAAASRGALLLTLDADASYALGGAHACIAAIRSGSDAAIGNRRDPQSQFVLHPAQLGYIGLRHAIGWIYNRLARALAEISVDDIQCGFKCYRGDLARQLFPRVDEDRFAFDLELIALLQHEGCRIVELPVVYTDRAQPTTVHLVRDGLPMIRRMLRIAARIRRQRRSGAFANATRGDYQDLARREGNPVQRFWHAQKWPLTLRTLELQEGHRVLDVGAGSSEIAQRAGECGALPCAVDVSLPALRFLHDHGAPAPGGSGPALRCVAGSAEQLPFRTSSFDRAVALEVIEHLPPEAASRSLAELRRVLAPSGRLLLTTPNYRSYWPALEYGVDRVGGVAEMGGVQHISRFHASSLRGALEHSGFRVLELGSVYHLSPFVAPVSPQIARKLFDWETRHGNALGPILFAVAEPCGA